MKKYLLLLVSLCFCGISFSEERISDLTLYQDISSSYENEYYPGSIEKVDILQSLYPDSVFTQPSLLLKAGALIKLNYYQDAKITLQNAITHMHTGKDGFIQCHYLLGLANFYLGLYEEALESFYLACKLSLINEEVEYYDASVFFSAESYYKLKDYENAYPLYEHVISKGNVYDKDEYTGCVIRLMDSYNQVGLYDKTASLYDSLVLKANEKTTESGEPYFSQDIVNVLTLTAANAEEKRGNYDRSYLLYSQVIEGGDESLAVLALKNAYVLSEKNLINVSIGELFSRVSETFNNKKIVDDFWVRLGIDEYNNQNYTKALTYFDKVENKENSNVITLYKAKIILDQDETAKGAKEAESVLEAIVLPKEGEEDSENISDTYYSLLLQCKVQQESWEGVPEVFAKIKLPSSKDIYNNSSYYYLNGLYDNVDPSTGVLYASSLCKRELYTEAKTVFEKLYNQDKLPKKYYSEYSNVLFILGYYEDAFNIALEGTDSHKDYVAALCKINMGNLDEAKNYLLTYIKKMSNSDTFIPLSIYYKGFIEYTLGDYKNAYNTFIRFNLEARREDKSYLRNSHYYAAMSSLQNKDFNSAAKEAKLYVDLSENREEKIKATIFNFEILNDAQKYDEAIELMMPYAKENTSFTPNALFKIASVYAKQGKVDLADSTYKAIYRTYPDSVFAEEAMYKCGEVYYFEEDYITSYNRFNDYIYKYVDGKYLDAALYFKGDSALKSGEIDLSIVINNNMLVKFPSSVYSYGAYKNLLTAFYKKEDFTNALDVATKLMKKYPEQAASDNIGTKIKELEQIVGGTDHRIAEKLSLYEKNGKTTTKKGRKIGSEIVKLYAENTYTQETAFEYANKILQEDIEEDEYTYIAEVAEFAGDYCRGTLKNKEAASYYLEAAQYYRSIQNTSKAAAVLYGAAEAFSASGLKGDAVEVAELLKELYPDTNYAALVDKIVR